MAALHDGALRATAAVLVLHHHTPLLCQPLPSPGRRCHARVALVAFHVALLRVRATLTIVCAVRHTTSPFQFHLSTDGLQARPTYRCEPLRGTRTPRPSGGSTRIHSARRTSAACPWRRKRRSWWGWTCGYGSRRGRRTRRTRTGAGRTRNSCDAWGPSATTPRTRPPGSTRPAQPSETFPSSPGTSRPPPPPPPSPPPASQETGRRRAAPSHQAAKSTGTLTPPTPLSRR